MRKGVASIHASSG